MFGCLSANLPASAAQVNLSCEGDTYNGASIQVSLWVANKHCSNPADKNFCDYNETADVSIQILLNGKILANKQGLQGSFHYSGTPANENVSRSLYSAAILDLKQSDGWQLDAAVLDPAHVHFHLSYVNLKETPSTQKIAYVKCENDLE